MTILTAEQVTVKLSTGEVIRVSEAARGASLVAGGNGGTFRDMDNAARVAQLRELARVLQEKAARLAGEYESEGMDFPTRVRNGHGGRIPPSCQTAPEPREFIRGMDSDDLIPVGSFVGHDA
jgi:hypothetical protein